MPDWKPLSHHALYIGCFAGRVHVHARLTACLCQLLGRVASSSADVAGTCLLGCCHGGVCAGRLRWASPQDTQVGG